MNNTTQCRTTWLGAAAALVWIALLFWLFIPVESASEQSADILPELARLASLFFGVSVLMLPIYLALRTRLSRQFIDFQALAGLLPLTFFATASSFLSYAVLRLGYFPRPNRPDPALIGLGMGQFAICWLALLAAASLFYIVLCRRGLVHWPNAGSRFAALLCFSRFSLFWLTLWLVAKHDAFSLIRWLGD